MPIDPINARITLLDVHPDLVTLSPTILAEALDEDATSKLKGPKAVEEMTQRSFWRVLADPVYDDVVWHPRHRIRGRSCPVPRRSPAYS